VSTAAEETRNPQRNLPIGVIASLGICTILHLAAVPLSSPQGASTVSRLVAGGADLLLQLWRAPQPTAKSARRMLGATRESGQ
jgi:amino acid transporter